MGAFFAWLWDCITGFFQPVVDFFYAVWDFIYSLMAMVGNWILDAVWWLVGCFLWCFFVCLDTVAVFGYETFAFLMDCFPEFDIPQAYTASVGAVMRVVTVIDCFVPVSVILSCTVVYTSFLAFWCVYKFIKSWIPTVSGS